MSSEKSASMPPKKLLRVTDLVALSKEKELVPVKHLCQKSEKSRQKYKFMSDLIKKNSRYFLNAPEFLSDLKKNTKKGSYENPTAHNYTHFS